jgi:hypothetical protein
MFTNPLLTLSSANLKKAATLQARIEQLQAKLAALLGTGRVEKSDATRQGAQRRTVSAARRKHLSAIATARWKKAKAAGKSTL